MYLDCNSCFFNYLESYNCALESHKITIIFIINDFYFFFLKCGDLLRC